jgi:molecular chaperone GrpE
MEEKQTTAPEETPATKEKAKGGKWKTECEQQRLRAEEMEKEAEESKRKWYAVTAEYENYRRRTQNQAAQRYQDGRNDVVSALFPVGDNLERALSSCSDENTRQGLEMILKSFKKVLEGEGVEEIDPTGEPFDAAFAEAIMAVPCEDGEESGTVKQVYLKGYKKGDKVLRYAQVIVTQ